MTEDKSAGPYKVELMGDHCVVTLPAFLDEPRTEAHAKELEDLVQKTQAVALDATGSVAISSEWIRFFYRLTVLAEQAGKTVGIVGLSEVLQESTDVLGLRDKLEMFGRIGEVWEA